MVEFATDGEWSARELGAALQALDRVYLVLIIAHELALETYDAMSRMRHLPSLTEGGGVDYVLRRAGAGPGQWLLVPFIDAYRLSIEEQHRSIDRLLANHRLFMDVGEELTLDRIRMESPGGFSLRGLGEPIRQLRELLKDLFFPLFAHPGDGSSSYRHDA